MRAGEPLRRSESGFTLIWLLAAVAVLGIGMALVGPLWAQQAQREREADLLHVGVAYAQAIEHYARISPGGVHQLPTSVDDLLLDPRFSTPVRHLRAAYTDPMRPGQPLELVLSPAGSIRGVVSTSDAAPLRQTPWTDGHYTLEPAAHYRDWQFLANVSQ
jgi:prepilin-type N-terminal cleavage/methylation domain-containing protein